MVSPALPGPVTAEAPCTLSGLRTHNSLLECNQLFFLFLSSFKVAVDEGLELHEVLVLTLFLDILGGRVAREKFLPFLASLRPICS